MKRKVAWAGAGFHLGEAGKHRRKDPLARVEAIDYDLIEAQIDGEREAIVGRGANPVGVRTFLALFIRAGAGMLDKAAGGAETSVIVNRERRDASAIVIRDQNEEAVFVERNMARSRAAGGHLIDELERAGFRIDG